MVLITALSSQAHAAMGWSAPSDGAMPPLQTENGDVIPAGAWGLIRVDSPMRASLYKLHGMAGDGLAIIRSSKAQECESIPIRFVAGDIAGHEAPLGSQQPILLEIHDAEIARALVRGTDIVSDQTTISVKSDGRPTALVITHGLSREQGFVLNPGRSFLNDILGVDSETLACQTVFPTAEAPPPGVPQTR